ncbi:MAG: tRNA (N6-threonylcarbamoyladenosine(37)-N6)-methyltransferase TrmO [Promethearchaeota archaeon]
MEKIEVFPIGFIKKTSYSEDVKDRMPISEIMLKKEFTEALDRIEDFSHIYVVFWLHKIEKTALKINPEDKMGILATRAPIRPNPIGLTLVELVKHDKNVLWVRGLDAYEGTPVLDIKPYPDWEQGRWVIPKNFRVPDWLENIIK